MDQFTLSPHDKHLAFFDIFHTANDDGSLNHNVVSRLVQVQLDCRTGRC